MVIYKVIMSAQAYGDLEEIYDYIAFELQTPQTADQMLDRMQEAIGSLKMEPERGPLRKVGKYADYQHRQIFVGNYTIIYRVDTVNKQVSVITIRYSPSRF